MKQSSLPSKYYWSNKVKYVDSQTVELQIALKKKGWVRKVIADTKITLHASTLTSQSNFDTHDNLNKIKEAKIMLAKFAEV